MQLRMISNKHDRIVIAKSSLKIKVVVAVPVAFAHVWYQFYSSNCKVLALTTVSTWLRDRLN